MHVVRRSAPPARCTPADDGRENTAARARKMESRGRRPGSSRRASLAAVAAYVTSALLLDSRADRRSCCSFRQQNVVLARAPSRSALAARALPSLSARPAPAPRLRRRIGEDAAGAVPRIASRHPRLGAVETLPAARPEEQLDRRRALRDVPSEHGRCRRCPGPRRRAPSPPRAGARRDDVLLAYGGVSLQA